MRRAAFNLIEVTLAMLVIALGVVAIFGLVPYGAKAHRDAIHNNRSADAASDILGYLAVQVRADWATWAQGANLGTAPTDISSDTNFPGDINDSTNYWRWATANIFTNHSPAAGASAVFRVCDTMAMPAVAGGRVVTDFDAIIRVWKSPSTAWQYNVGPPDSFTVATDASYDSRIILNAEVSWPASPAAYVDNAPSGSGPEDSFGFKNRRKAYYALEISR